MLNRLALLDIQPVEVTSIHRLAPRALDGFACLFYFCSIQEQAARNVKRTNLKRQLFAITAGAETISLVSARTPEAAVEVAEKLVRVPLGFESGSPLCARRANKPERARFCGSSPGWGTVQLAGIIVNIDCHSFRQSRTGSDG
jgi:hypothetical protein